METTAYNKEGEKERERAMRWKKGKGLEGGTEPELETNVPTHEVLQFISGSLDIVFHPISALPPAPLH